MLFCPKQFNSHLKELTLSYHGHSKMQHYSSLLYICTMPPPPPPVLTLVSISSSWLSMATPEFLREAALPLRVFFRGLPQLRQDARLILLPQPQDTQFLNLLTVGVVRPRRLGVGIGGWALVSSLSGTEIQRCNKASL